MNENKIAAKSGVIFALATMVNAGLSFFTTPYFTRMTSQEAFGEYNNFLSWYNIFLIVSLNLSASLISAREDYKKDINSYTFSIAILNILLVSSFGIVLLFCGNTIYRVTGVEKPYLIIMAVYIAFNQIFLMFQNNERFAFNYKIAPLLIVSCAIFVNGLSMILVKYFRNQVFARIIGITLPTVIIGSICFVIIVKRGRNFKISYWKYALPICIPYIPHLLSLTVLNATDKAMISFFVGNSKTAIYSVAYTFGTIVSLIVGIFNSALAPWMAKKIAIQKEKEVLLFSRYYIIIFQMLLICMLMMSPELLFLIGGEKYAEAIQIIPIIIIGCGIQLIYTMYVNIEQFYKNTKLMAFVSVIAAITNLVLNIVLIPQSGYKVAAITTLVSYLVLAIGHMLIVRKMDNEKMVDEKTVYIMLVIDAFLLSIFYSIRGMFLLRLLIVFLGLCCLGVCVKKAIKLFR